VKGGATLSIVEVPPFWDPGAVNGGDTVEIVGVGAVKGGDPLKLAPALPVCDSAGEINVKVLSTTEPVEGAIEMPVAEGDGASDCRLSSPRSSGPPSSQDT
jgi:hypothetical protein